MTAIATRRYAVPGGITLAADVGGDPSRPAVLLLHGGGQTRHSWHRAMHELVQSGYHVINLDSRGHGESDWAPDGDYSLATQTADLRAVIATLEANSARPPALVGASMGGIVSLYLVGTSDTQIAGTLILVDVVPRISTEGAHRIAAFMRAHPQGFASLDEAADAVAAYNPHRPRPSDNSGLMKNLRKRADGRLYWHWDPAFLQSRLEPPQLAEQLLTAAGRIPVPTLLVRGMQSDIVSDEGIAEFRRRLPALETFDVGAAGHMVAGDKNDAFNRGVIGFLHRHHPA